MTVHAIGIAFRKIKKKLGFNEYHYYTLKTFRKNFATDMSSMGMTIQEVQVLLDHKDPATTLRYECRPDASLYRSHPKNFMIFQTIMTIILFKPPECKRMLVEIVFRKSTD